MAMAMGALTGCYGYAISSVRAIILVHREKSLGQEYASPAFIGFGFSTQRMPKENLNSLKFIPNP